MDSSLKDFFSADNLRKLAEDVEPDENLFESLKEYSVEDVEKYGALARDRIDSIGMDAAKAVDNPEEFSACLRRFWSVIREEKLFSCWIQCCCLKTFPDAVFDIPKDSNQTKDKKISRFKGKRISEILSAMSVSAFDNNYTQQVISSFNPAKANKNGFAGYFYSCLEKKAKEMFSEEYLEDKLKGAKLKNKNQERVLKQVSRVIDSLNIDLDVADEKDYSKIIHKVKEKNSWAKDDSIRDYINIIDIARKNFSYGYLYYYDKNGYDDSAPALEFDNGKKTIGLIDGYSYTEDYDSQDSRNIISVEWKSAAFESLTEKQKRIYSADLTWKLLNEELQKIKEFALKDLKEYEEELTMNRMSMEYFMDNYFDEYVLQGIEDAFNNYAKIGQHIINYDVFRYLMDNHKMPEKQDLAEMYGVSKSDFAHTRDAAEAKIRAYR